MEDKDLKAFKNNCKHDLITKTARLLDLNGKVVAKKVECKKCGGIGYQKVKGGKLIKMTEMLKAVETCIVEAILEMELARFPLIDSIVTLNNGDKYRYKIEKLK